MRRLFQITGIAALLCFAVLGWLGLTELTTHAGGTFDARFLGYDLDEAKTYVGSLSPAATVTYLKTFRYIDSVFPVLLAAWIWIGFRLYNMRFGGLFLSVIYLVSDFRENRLVAEILRTEPLTELLVTQASQATVMKWLALAVAFACLAVLKVRRRA